MTRSGAPQRILTLGALTAFAPMSIDMYLPAFTALQHDLHTTPDAVQRTLVVFFIGLAIGQAFWGPVSDRFGRKRPLLLGIALYVVASIGCAFAASIGSLLWRLLQALGGCAGIVIARSMVRDLYPPVDAARVFSRLTLVLGAAPILAPLAGAAIVQALGWRAIFAVLAAFGLLCFVAALALPESLAVSAPRVGSPTRPPRGMRPAAPSCPAAAWTEPNPSSLQAARWTRKLGAARRFLERARSSATRHPVRDALRIYGALLRDRRYIGFALSGALGQSAMFAYIAGAPFVFMQVFGLSPTQFGWLFGLNALGLIAASQLNHALLARVPSGVLLGRALRSLAVWAGVMLGLAALQIGGFWGVALPLFVALSSLGFSFPNATALALAHQTGRVGSAAALMGSMQFTLATLSGAAVGLFSTHSATPMAAVFCLFACLALAAHRRLASA